MFPPQGIFFILLLSNILIKIPMDMCEKVIILDNALNFSQPEIATEYLL